jgi:hypothetical protein
MIESGKIFFVLMFLIFAVNSSFSQNLTKQADTLKTNSTVSVSKDQSAKVMEGKQPGTNGVSNGIQTAKQIRGSRPDMSKARGARPPLILRPSGSGIPKGAGKPGGAGRYGGR